MSVGKAEFHPYITRLKAELRKYTPNITDTIEESINSPCGVWEWQKGDIELWQALIAMDKRLTFIEAQLNKPKPKRPVISSTGYHKGFLHSDGTVHPFAEDE